MTRQSISFTKPNEEWLREQVKSEEYSSKSELVNDLIRKERKKKEEIAWLQSSLDKAVKDGISNLTMEEIRQEALARFNGKI